MIRTKHALISQLISRLEFDRRGWVVSDYWEADLLATGIEAIAHRGRLVYITIRNKLPGLYDYQLESPPQISEHVYDRAGGGDDVAFEELVEAMVAHLVACVRRKQRAHRLRIQHLAIGPRRDR